MRIGVVTNLDKRNYGSVLQAYALQSILKNMGSDNFVLEKKVIMNNSLMARAKRFFALSKNNYSLKYKLEIAQARKLYTIKQKKIVEFCNKYIDVSTYTDNQQIIEKANSCQLMIAGSDQIWSPASGMLSEFYLLNFGEKTTYAKASYSASIGVSEVSEDDKALFKKNLADFDTVSLREKTGLKLLSECTDNPVRTDLDPSLLYDGEYWSKFLNNYTNTKEPYIFVYMLRPEPVTLEAAKKLSEKTGFKIKVCSNRIVKGKNIENITDAGIEDFLSLIYNAKYMITNSFHGTAFAVQFHKKFLSLAVAHTGSRVRDFLEDINLSDRTLTTPQDISKIDNEIYWSDTDKILNEKRKQSHKYLQELINKYSK